jgi:L1 cell adhesion molecule like protein
MQTMGESVGINLGTTAVTGESVGIDLGTTYSSVGIWQNDRVEFIANDQGNLTTPSCIAFTDIACLIGDSAKSQAAVNASNTVTGFMRLMGRKFSDAAVQASIVHWPFVVKAGPGDRPQIHVTYKGREVRYFAEELCAMLLRKMKEFAEAFTGKAVRNVVISVSNDLSPDQRSNIMDAGAIAGLRVLRVIPSGSAASTRWYRLQPELEGRGHAHSFHLRSWW